MSIIKERPVKSVSLGGDFKPPTAIHSSAPTSSEALFNRVNVRALTQFLVLVSLALFLPFFIHLQWLTGPIINAILILTLFLVGIRSAMVVALAPSLMALAGGFLPAILAPVVPFIMISNVIFILCIDWLFRNTGEVVKGYWLGVLASSLFKFIFLFFSVSFIARLLIKQELAVKVAQMMSWPQFATAMMGGMIAWVILRWLKRF